MRWTMYVIGGITAATVILLAFGVYISPKDELERSDMIVAISGGDTYSRAAEAVHLYQEGWAPRILFSGAALDPNSESNALAMRNLAVKAGVPPDAINIEESADNTRENASLSAAMITALGSERIVLVTSPYHQRRANLEFAAQLGGNVHIINHPAPDERWSRSSWWRSPFGWYITASEAPKVLYALTQS